MFASPFFHVIFYLFLTSPVNCIRRFCGPTLLIAMCDGERRCRFQFSSPDSHVEIQVSNCFPNFAFLGTSTLMLVGQIAQGARRRLDRRSLGVGGSASASLARHSFCDGGSPCMTAYSSNALDAPKRIREGRSSRLISSTCPPKLARATADRLISLWHRHNSQHLSARIVSFRYCGNLLWQSCLTLSFPARVNWRSQFVTSNFPPLAHRAGTNIQLRLICHIIAVIRFM